MSFELRWAKECGECGEMMEEGDIVKYQDDEIVHNECADEPDED